MTLLTEGVTNILFQDVSEGFRPGPGKIERERIQKKNKKSRNV